MLLLFSAAEWTSLCSLLTTQCGHTALERAVQQATAKQSRGWDAQVPDRNSMLPEADLLTFTIESLTQLLLESALLGWMLWNKENKVLTKLPYKLTVK